MLHKGLMSAVELAEIFMTIGYVNTVSSTISFGLYLRVHKNYIFK